MNIVRFILIMFFLVPISAIHATIYTAKGAYTGDWANAATWTNDNGAWPGDGDDVLITNAGSVVILSATSSNLSTLTNSRTIIFNNWNSALRADNVTILSGGRFTAYSWPTNLSQSNNIYVICSNLTVANGGSIDATARGYPGMYGTDGLGPGGGSGTTSSGTHGGKGFNNSLNVYGDVMMPLDGGSAGGASGTYTGGAGGGAIRIDASGDITIDGSIVADGGMPGAVYSSAGSGGAIYIQCSTIQGSGLISAAGEGNGLGGSYSKGGGGGRIAIIYDTTNQAAIQPVPELLFRLCSGLSAGPSATQVGEPGTLYFPDNYFLMSPFRHTAQWMVPDFTNWTLNALGLTNACLWIPVNGFALNVSNDVRILGTNEYLHHLRLVGGIVRVGGNFQMATSRLDLLAGAGPGPDLMCAGDITFDKRTIARIFSVPTNGITTYGAVVDVMGTFTITTNSTLYLYCSTTNGGGPFIQAQNMTIDAGGIVDAAGKGYKSTTIEGIGPGGGAAATRGGGGHGGKGGNSSGGRGVTNGIAEMPLNAGSSGAGYSIIPGDAGGGIVRIKVADKLTVDGSINADGASGSGNAAGGAGGSIWLQCYTFSGSGSLSADGGDGTPSNGSGGGGGRIAIWRVYDKAMNVATSVLAGLGTGSGGTGDPGTVVWIQLQPRGSIINIK